MKVSDVVKGGVEGIVGKFMKKAADPVDKKVIQDLFNPIKSRSLENPPKAG